MATKYSVTKEIFSKRLKELMNDNNETTYSIGEILNLSAATISRYADGKMAPKITTIYSMATHFNVNPVWLMGYDVEKTLKKQTNNRELSQEETTLLENYNKLDIEDKNRVIDYTKLLHNQDKYKNLNNTTDEISATKDNVVEIKQKDLTYDDFETVAAHNDGLTDDEISEADRRILEDLNKRK